MAKLSVSSVVVAVLGALAVLATGSSPSWAASEYVRIRFLPDQEPAVYVQFTNDTLRCAASIEELATAKPVRAPRSQRFQYDAGPSEYVRGYQFPETDLPISGKGIARASAALRIFRTYRLQRSARSQPTRSTYVAGEFRIAKQDGTGTVWTYTFSGSVTPESRATTQAMGNPATSPIMDIPDLDKLKLTIETKVEGKKARIGLRLMAGEVWISDLARGGKGAPARLEATNKEGKTVLSEQGDLKKFGFT